MVQFFFRAKKSCLPLPPKIFLRKFTYRIFKTQCQEKISPEYPMLLFQITFFRALNLRQGYLFFRNFPPKSQNTICFLPDSPNFLLFGYPLNFLLFEETKRQKIKNYTLRHYNPISFTFWPRFGPFEEGKHASLTARSRSTTKVQSNVVVGVVSFVKDRCDGQVHGRPSHR